MSNLVGKPAPTFGTLLDQDGQPVDSTTFIGKQPLCIFFYPAAMTYGCNKEACAFRDVGSRPSFSSAANSNAIRILGISSDGVEKQKQFALKYNLNYTVLADTEKQARKAFNVAGTALMGTSAQRVTFIIDGQGKIRATEDSSMNIGAHTKLLEKWTDILTKESQAP